MKVSPEISQAESGSSLEVSLPHGLVGFPDHHSFEIVADPEQAPFQWLRLNGPDLLDFVVIEPTGIIADYEIELFDEDAEFLGITDGTNVTIYNIVTVRPGANATATVNLTAPVIVNRKTRVAKQCILENYSRYSAFHPLVEGDNSAQR